MSIDKKVKKTNLYLVILAHRRKKSLSISKQKSEKYPKITPKKSIPFK
jgi:hypothetical protein